jgi:putative spermidine/putrescine transport system substrate-binding protein
MAQRRVAGLAIILALAAPVVAALPAAAQTRTLYFASYGGSFEQVVRRSVIPAFEQKSGAKVEYVAGNSTDTLAKLQAQKGNQQIDVIVVDDGPAYQAIELGFCDAVQPAKVYDDLYPNAKLKSGKGVAVGLVGTGIMYNRKVFEENKWPAPTSWADLKDPKFRKKLVVPPLNNTYGLHALIAAAEINGGGVANIEPGFKAFRSDFGPNVLAYEPSPAKMTELFQNGQAAVAIWGSGRAKAFADTGFPAEFVYPKEGGIALGLVGCPVAGAKNAALAQDFLQFLVSPEIQQVFAVQGGNGPSNATVKLTPEQQRGLPYGDEAKALKVVDWDVVNAKREEWNKRWTREIER